MRADSLEQYLEITENFDADNVFRGQGADYPQLKPSIYRHSNPPNIKVVTKLVYTLYREAYNIDLRVEMALEEERAFIRYIEKKDKEWQIFVEEYEKENMFSMFDPDVSPAVLSGCDTPIMYDEYYGFNMNEQQKAALLQHYGVPSTGLDVSFEPLVALFFATHRFLPKAGRYFQKANDGVVYILNPNRKCLQDLRGGKNLPSAGLRGKRQHGALLFASNPDEVDLSSYIKHKVIVSEKTWDESNPEINKFNESILFPSIDEDEFYRKLLEVKQDADKLDILRWVTEYIK